MALDSNVGEGAQRVFTDHLRVVDRAHTDMAGGDAHDDAGGLDHLALNLATGGEYRQRSGGRHAKCVKRRGDEVFAQHGTQRAAAVRARTRKRRATGAFGVEIPTGAVAVDDLAEKQCAAIAHAGIELAELVARVRHGVGLFAVAEEKLDALGRTQPLRVEAELGGEFLVEQHETGVGMAFAARGRDEVRKCSGVAVLDGGVHGAP